MAERPYTVATLAAYWGCSPDVIYALIREGRLRAFKLGGKLIRIRPDDVEHFECQNTGLSATGETSLSPTLMANEAAFESRLARMTEGSRNLALVTSGGRATSRSQNA